MVGICKICVKQKNSVMDETKQYKIWCGGATSNALLSKYFLSNDVYVAIPLVMTSMSNDVYVA
jgi:hypothetical protein